MTSRIDVHQHVLPSFWVEGLRERGSPHRPPPWSPEAALAFMDTRGVATSVLSLTAPGLSAWAEADRRDAARRVNDYTAELGVRWPGRFGSFATLPLPDIEGALEETAYALDTLKADGVALLSNYGDLFLGDPLFEPLWRELDRRAAVVFIHPNRTTLPELAGIPAPFIDFPFATTRTAVHMVLKGVFDRYANLSVVLSHAGGFLPFAAYRVATTAQILPGVGDAEAILAKLRRFYFDTALSSSPSAVASLREFADPSRILFGSDFPYAPGGPAEGYTELLDASPWLSDDEHAAVDSGNAAALLGLRRG